MKQKTSGISDTKVNDVGNPKIHEKHKVVLEKDEGDAISKARVVDQLEIDRMLLADKITSLEHKAAEYMLQVFVDAGVFVKTVDMHATSSGRFQKSNYNYGLLRLRDTGRVIEDAVGEDETVMVMSVIAKDLPLVEEEIPVFRLAMQALDKNYIGITND